MAQVMFSSIQRHGVFGAVETPRFELMVCFKHALSI
jgi:hypothetical protein